MTHDDAVRNVRELAAQLDGRIHGSVATPAQLRHVADMADAAKRLEEALQLSINQNSHDMVLTGDELRFCEAALAAMPKPPA